MDRGECLQSGEGVIDGLWCTRCIPGVYPLQVHELQPLEDLEARQIVLVLSGEYKH